MKKRYRVIVKVLCSNCFQLKQTNQPIFIKCAQCEFIKYNNVTDLVSFTRYLDLKRSGWVYFNVFRYIKQGEGEQLGNYTNGKNRRVPTSYNEL